MGSLFGDSGPDPFPIIQEGRQSAVRALRRGQQQALTPLQAFQPLDITAGGLTTTTTPTGVAVAPTAQRLGAVGGLARTFGQQAQALGGLREQVAPGFGRLTSARLQEIENARRQAIGNLRENLARRRVLGSSFAQDAITRANLEFAQQAEETAAESFVQELQLTNQLINQQFEASRGEFQTQLNELNLEAQLGQQFAAQGTQVLTALAQEQANIIQSTAANLAQTFTGTARTEAGLAAQAQQGQGQLLGGLLNLGLTGLTTPIAGTSLLGQAFS